MSTLTSPIARARPDAAEASVVRKVAWRLMPLIMVCDFFAFFDRINISFAKFPLQRDLALSNTAYGLGASLFVVGYVVFEVPSNFMLYRVGARRWIARIMISWGLATAAMVFVRAEWQFYSLRFVIGAMEAGFAPGVLYYMTLWFPAAFRGRITALFFVASACSGIIGAPIAGFVLGYADGALSLAGWQWLFLTGGLPCLLLGILVLLRFDDRVEDARWLTDAEKATLGGTLQRQTAAIGEHSFARALLMPGVLLLGLVYFLIQVGSYGLNFWGPDLIKTAGAGNPTLIGLLTAMPYVCGAVTMVVVGRLLDRSGERTRYVAGLIIAGGLGFLSAGVFDHNVVLLLASLAVLGAGIVAFWALPPKIVTGVGAAGGMALINTLGQLGSIVSPTAVGWIKDATGSTTPALFAIGLLCLLCGGLLLFAMPEALRRRDD